MQKIEINLVKTVNVNASQAVELMRALEIVERFAELYGDDVTDTDRRRRRRRRRLRLHVSAEC